MYSGVSFVKRRRLCSCFYCRCEAKMRILPVGHGTRDRRKGGHTVGNDQKKTFVVVLLTITHLTSKDGLC